MEKMYEVKISDTFSVEAEGREDAIEQVLLHLAEWLDTSTIEVSEY